MSSEITALAYTALALAAGLALVLACLRKFKVESGATLVAVLFAPALLYLGMSGRLVEFKGLGLEARFQQVASKRIEPTAIKPIATSAPAIRDLSEAKSYLAIGTEVVLLVAPSTDVPVTRQRVLDVALQIYPGLLQSKFEVLVVLDSSDRVIGYFPRSYFFDLLRIEIEQTIRGARDKYDSSKVGEQLEQTQLWDIVAYPKLRAERSGSKLFMKAAESNASVLSQLASHNQDAAVVVDAAGQYAGIIRRVDIVAAMLGSVAAQDAAPGAK